nr:hypothetical protein [Tanacetum cinerariifolium]
MNNCPLLPECFDSDTTFGNGDMLNVAVRDDFEKGKKICTSVGTARGSFFTDGGIQLYGRCSELGDSWLLGSGSGCSGVVLDFQNLAAHFPYAKQAVGVSFSASDLGTDQVVLDFEKSILHLPSDENDTQKLAKLNKETWFRSNVVNGFLRDDCYECLFRQSGSVETQGESFSMNSGHRSCRTEYGPLLQGAVVGRNVDSADLSDAGRFCPNQIGQKGKRRAVPLQCESRGPEHSSSSFHEKTIGPTQSRAIRMECAYKFLAVHSPLF